MSGIVTLDYYSSLFADETPQDFYQLEKRAEREVRNVIGAIRWATISTNAFYYEQLQDCICNVMKKLMDNDKSGVGKGVSSVSNAGYSENYAIQTESQAREELQGLICAWLSGTGLVGAY